MKKIIVIAVIAIGILVAKEYVVDNVEKELVAGLEKIKTQLPQKVDSDTEIFDITKDGKTIAYHIRLINISSDEFDIDKFRSVIEPAFLKNVCSDKNIHSFLGLEYIIQYKSYDKDDYLFTTFEFSKNSCA